MLRMDIRGWEPVFRNELGTFSDSKEKRKGPSAPLISRAREPAVLRVEHMKIGALPPLTFEVADGECFAVEGPSGVGKTRLLRAIAALDPAEGQVFLDGEERNEMRADRWRKLVRYASSEPGWWTETPREAFPRSPALDDSLYRLLGTVDLDASYLDRPLSTLSTGERQRLAFVRAIIDEPRVLLFDEPTAALDPASAALIEELIRFQLLSSRSVVVVTHDAGLSKRLPHARLQLAKPVPVELARRSNGA